MAPEDDEPPVQLLQRVREAQVVFATDRAPASEFFWRGYGSRRQYAAVRHGKTRNLHVLGFHPFLWAAQQQRSFHRRLADYGEEANGREGQSHQG